MVQLFTFGLCPLLTAPARLRFSLRTNQGPQHRRNRETGGASRPYNRGMEPLNRTWIALALLCSPVAFGQNAEPTREEIAEAYRSKRAEGGTFIPGTRWEVWRIRQIRGWSLHFKRVSESRGAGILTRNYRALARKSGSCAGYRVTDTLPLPSGNVQIRPMPVVEPNSVRACQ